VKLTDLDLNKLSIFLLVADSGGVGKAAKRLGRTSSAVSQSISGLETALGAPLFDRVGKRLVLTRGGQTLRERVAASEQLLEQGVTELRGEVGEPSGVVRLGAYLGFPRQRLCALLLDFTRLHPRASVRVVHAPGRELERRLQNNRLDFVLAFGAAAPAGSPLVSTRLFSQELVLVASDGHFEAGFSLDVLGRTPIVDYYPSDPLIERWLAHHYPRRVPTFCVRFWAATTDLVLELLLRGAGAGVLPRHVARAHLERAELVELGPKQRPLVDPIWLQEPRGAHRDVTLRAFRAVARRVANAEPR
jgi:DNA-binding transcriptional LysR family regulator